MNRIELIALALLGLAFVGLSTSGCDPYRVEESVTEEHRFDLSGDAVVEVRIDDGRIDVTRGDPGVVEVVFTKRARAADRAGARALLDNLRARAFDDNGVIRVEARAGIENVISLRGSVSTDVLLRVPELVSELDVRTHDGRIEIEGVSGTILAESEDGRIRLANVAGTVRLRARDGSITATGISADVDVESDDGRIQLDGSFGQLRAVTADGSIRITCRDRSEITDEWIIRTLDGSIELALPEGLAATIEATTADGRVVSHLSELESSGRENRLRGTLGAGGPLILITTIDGRITLKES